MYDAGPGSLPFYAVLFLKNYAGQRFNLLKDKITQPLNVSSFNFVFEK